MSTGQRQSAWGTGPEFKQSPKSVLLNPLNFLVGTSLSKLIAQHTGFAAHQLCGWHVTYPLSGCFSIVELITQTHWVILRINKIIHIKDAEPPVSHMAGPQ